MKYFSYSLFFVALFSGSVFAQSTDSLDIKIGQMILIGFPKDNVDLEVLREIRQGKVGSIIIFEKNIPAKNSFVALKKITWTYQHAAPIPLFICIDQEGICFRMDVLDSDLEAIEEERGERNDGKVFTERRFLITL